MSKSQIQSSKFKSHLSLVICHIVCLLLALFPARASAAVTISSFKAQWQGTQVSVTWVTATEVDNAGFNILRSTSASGTFAKINPSLIPTKCLGCIAGTLYSFTDSTATPGQTFYYKLQSVDNGGGTQLFGPASAAASAPSPTPTVPPPTATATRGGTAAPTKAVPPTATTIPAASPTPTTRAPATATATPIPNATSIPSPQWSPTRAPSSPSTVTSTPRRIAAVQPSQTPVRPSPSGIATITPAGARTAAPGQTLVAIAIKAPTEEPDDSSPPAAADSQSGDNTSVLRTLIWGGIILLSGFLGLGSLVLGTIAFYLLVRPYLR